LEPVRGAVVVDSIRPPRGNDRSKPGARLNTEQAWPQIRDWRKQQRAALVERRVAVPPATLGQWGAAMTGLIVSGFPMLAGMTIGFCWPYKNEFDARFAVRRFRDQGATAALPAVVEKAGPLQFRKWWPGAPVKPGVYDIPVPDGTEIVLPDAAIVPMNGFDGGGYRLGYGGGYFDRTLASLSPRPLVIGASFEFARLATIRPQPHDIPMDFVVTEAGLHAVAGGRLERVDAAACRDHAQRLCDERRLPRPKPAVDGLSSPVCYASEFPGYFGGDEKKK
jgi:5-formyltetrahydrofolate cyclo-ligase